jgi:hypothetical protein
MKKVLQSFLAAGVLLTAAQSESYAQPVVDLTLTGSPNMGTYPGYVLPGVFGLTFQNPSIINLPAGSFQIVLTLPTGIEFDLTYPGIPAGWNYLRTTTQSVTLTPTAPVVGILPSVPASIVSFAVPFTTTQTVNSQTFSAQIQRIGLPFYQDNDQTNNSPTGTVSVTNLPLPVTFESFDAKVKGCEVLLNWITSTERNNDVFKVERSADGKQFEEIAQVKSAGNGNAVKRYNFVDANPLNGKNLYRIVQVDMDRNSTATQAREVSVNCEAAVVELYPNPANVKLFVKGLKGTSTIRVFNVLGQQVMEETTELPIHELDVQRLAAATYQVQVSNGANIVFSGKFLKGE